MTKAVEAEVSTFIRDMRYLFTSVVLAAGIAAWVAVTIIEKTDSGGGSGSIRMNSITGSAERRDVFGPGILIPSQTSPVPLLQPPADASVDADGNLAINSELLAVLDFFLIEQSDDGEAAMEDYFASRLSNHAHRQAGEIARNYRSYMAEHDRQLAVQNLTSRDMSRIANWVSQRARLRMLTIGGAASTAWYQNDDAQLQQALNELGSNAVSPESVGAQPGVPRWTRAEDGIRHRQYLQRILERNLLKYEERHALARRQAINQSQTTGSTVRRVEPAMQLAESP